MDVWDEPFDRARRDEIECVCAGPAGEGRAVAWRTLVLAIAPHIERQARTSALLRRCGLTDEDEARWVLVDALERLSRNDHENLRAFRSRQRPIETGAAPQDALDALGGLFEAEVTPEGDGVDAGAPPATPFRGWLRGLVKYTIRDHLRRRLGAPPAEGCPGKRDVGTDAARFATGEEPGVRPPVTDWVGLRAAMQEIDEHLGRMPPVMQAALRHWSSDASFDEIARAVGLEDAERARATVRAGLARLRERLRPMRTSA